MTEYESLLPFCKTPRQTEILNEVIADGSIRGAEFDIDQDE